VRPSSARQTATEAAVPSRRWPLGSRTILIHNTRAFRARDKVRHSDNTLATGMNNLSAGRPADASGAGVGGFGKETLATP